MRRREFVQVLSALPAFAADKPEGRVMTVLGPVKPPALGATLSHEHVMTIFGAEPADKPFYDTRALFEAAMPYLKTVKKHGCGALADCTGPRLGRAPDLLRRMSRESGLHILTCTGAYGAAKDRYVPPYALQETTAQLAERWAREWREGIDGTGIRPGFIKIGVDGAPLSAIDRKLVQAAARTHAGSGLAIASHTGGNIAAVREQLEILRAEGVSPAAWIWVHAQAAKEADLNWAADRGAWLSFDGLNVADLGRYLELVRAMKRAGRLSQVLLSHDGEIYPVPGTRPRPFHALFTNFVPKLRESGFSEAEIQGLIAANPQRALTIGVRRAV